jgi:HAD superfamily hydrolase (TIGR01509 family)
MEWIHQFQFFLFDMDGLLVNTEELHFLAYKKMCLDRGFVLDWSFARYCQAAHYSSDALRDQIYAHLPSLYTQEPNWNVLYAEKRQNMLHSLQEGAVQLMPGVSELLTTLKQAAVPCCVVTHSPSLLVSTIRIQQPLLDSIPFWVTREDYGLAKPHPEGYLKAIQKYIKKGERIVGFEDTPRGMQALMQTPVQAVMVSQIHYPETAGFVEQGALHFPTFSSITQPHLTLAPQTF